MWDSYSHFLGLEFEYDDSTRILYGRRCPIDNTSDGNGIEVPFLIDGAAGEHIITVRVRSTEEMVDAIQVGG